MITDIGIWTIVINLVAIAFAVQYSRSETFGEALLWLVWDFMGLRFIVCKVFPLKTVSTVPPVTISLWGIGIYTALFGIASNRYENSVDKIENRMNAFITQLAVISQDVRKVTFQEIEEIQSMQCPVKPDILMLRTMPDPKGSGCGLIIILRRHGNGGGRGGKCLEMMSESSM